MLAPYLTRLSTQDRCPLKDAKCKAVQSTGGLRRPEKKRNNFIKEIIIVLRLRDLKVCNVFFSNGFSIIGIVLFCFPFLAGCLYFFSFFCFRLL
jgi:hypothetical protein